MYTGITYALLHNGWQHIRPHMSGSADEIPPEMFFDLYYWLPSERLPSERWTWAIFTGGNGKGRSR